MRLVILMSFPKEWEQIKKAAFEVFKQRIESRAEVWCDIKGGAETGTTYRGCKEAFSKFLLNMNVIDAPVEPKTETVILNKHVSTPIMIAPMSSTITQIKPDAFVDLAKAAGDVESIAWIGYPNKRDTLQEVVSKKFSPIIYIVKPLKDRGRIIEELRFAEALGVHAVGVDVDSSAGLIPIGDEPHYMEMSAPISTSELVKIRRSTGLPFIVKGVLCRRDARAALRAGADAVVVSNHAGFALDYSVPSVIAINDINKEIGGKLEVYLDSGVRRGSDILKALALGARAVLIGTVALWGLAIGGSEGVAHILRMLTSELKRTMMLTSVESVDKVPRTILRIT
jgi:isopentenyl diphosphate isomerase/L-lactate dehydrogenase-like FMN-dependent dehydrogenase